jgi:hypothetical protein
MTTYCVWFDNFFQEFFALEKNEFDKYDRLQTCLKKEKNNIHFIEADSCFSALSKYKKQQKEFTTKSILTH